jgi:hypothetical protein
MKILSLIFLLSFSLSLQAAWNLNDVSFLLPFPEGVQDSLLNIKSAGANGPLLPRLLVDQLPPLVMSASRGEMDDALRVVSVRLDPCFVTLPPERCEKQIRFVWQPILSGPGHVPISTDAALHSFYLLTDEQFSRLLLDLQAWKKKWNLQTDALPLQVLPALQNPAVNNPTLKDLLSIFLRYTSQSNLIRVTAMVLRGGADMWAFMQFDIVDGKPMSQPIPRLSGKLTQAFVNQVNPATSFGRVAVAPQPEGSDVLKVILSPSTSLGPEKDAEIKREMEILGRIENPKNFHANNMDCVTCHVAEAAKQWVLRDKGYLDLQHVLSYESSRHNLKNTTPQMWNTQMVRAFGYFGRNPAISQRVINESAEVADLLSNPPTP